jgi:branched-chain amino acid transport system permease protein
MNRFGAGGKIIGALFFLFVVVLPLLPISSYIIHVVTLIFIWSLIATAWSYMGRFGLVSLGHGAFMGIGAYVTALLFNSYHLSPWLGMFVGGAGACFLGAILGYACFRFGVIGDYFALVTLAVAELIALLIVAFREVTGGSLGMTIKSVGTHPWLFQFENRIYFYYIALAFLLIILFVWKWIDRSVMRRALTAIGEDELAASSLGVNIIRNKMTITIISTFFTSLGGTIYAQYVTYLSPETVAGVGVSLSIPFKAILGGMFTLWGPFIGTAIIVSLEEYVRIAYGGQYTSLSQIIYGLALILLIMFLPKGIFGTIREKFQKK